MDTCLAREWPINVPLGQTGEWEWLGSHTEGISWEPTQSSQLDLPEHSSPGPAEPAEPAEQLGSEAKHLAWEPMGENGESVNTQQQWHAGVMVDINPQSSPNMKVKGGITECLT